MDPRSPDPRAAHTGAARPGARLTGDPPRRGPIGRALRAARWSPYAVGAGLGVLSWLTFGLMGKALGTSTTMVRATGMAEGLLAPDAVQDNAYFAKYLVGKPGFEWQFALVVMLAVGAFVAARLSGAQRPPAVPALWAARFGPSKTRRYAFAFLGGVILLFGARLAGGCTSGHGISGGLQLAVSSWTFLAFTFLGGIAMARALFRRTLDSREARHVGH